MVQKRLSGLYRAVARTRRDPENILVNQVRGAQGQLLLESPASMSLKLLFALPPFWYEFLNAADR
jgi:hypothetical protein